MVMTSVRMLRRPVGHLLTLVAAVAGLVSGVSAQTPSVVSNMPAAVLHNEVYGNPWQTSVTNRGDFVLFDFKTSGLYQYPANNGAEVTVAAPNVIAGGFSDSGIAVDPRNNNLYLDNNYNGGLLMYPYDAKTGTWDLPSVAVAGNLSGNVGGSSSCGATYFQSVGLSMNANGVLAVATENGCGVEIFTVPVDLQGNFGTPTPIVSNMSARAKTVAIDNAGNIYFNEDGGIAGALYIPAGVTGLQDDKSVARLAPMVTDPTTQKMSEVLTAVQGVTVDADGNVYVVDGNVGAYQFPLVKGVPSVSQALQLSPVPANGGPSIDSARGILFYPTSGSGTIKDLVKVYLNRNEFGANTVSAATGTVGSVTYNFLAAKTTPYSFNLLQDGTSTFSLGDLSTCGITLTPILDASGKPVLDKNGNPTYTETTKDYAAGSTCTLPVTFLPTTVGRQSATLQMLDAQGNVLNTTVLHGSGTGATALVLPATEAAIGAGFKTPSQIAVDASANIYVADPAQTTVISYAKGSGGTAPVSLGTGLKAPTGVAVDGAGNVYIADSGQVVEIPNTPTGLSKTVQTVIKTGLGSNLKLAADSIGNLYIADPDNQRYVQLRSVGQITEELDVTGFPQLTAIASDGAGDLFLASGTNVIEVSIAGQQVLSSTSSGVNGLATDHSGALYISSTAQTVRIPLAAGVLDLTNQTVIAAAATKPTSVAVGPFGNVYVTDAAAGNIDFVVPNGSLNLGKLATPTSQSTGNATVYNNGNAPLTITGFSSTLDYSVTSNTCVGKPVAIGANCNATVTFNPGPGNQGTLTAQLAVQGNEFYTPVVINTTGVGATLAGSKSTIIINKPSTTTINFTVNVASAAGTGPVPTGNVTVTVTGLPAGSTPLVYTLTLVNGAASLTPVNVPAGSLLFSVKYIGDRVYGVSTTTSSVTVMPGTVTLTQPPAASVPVYVLASGTGAQEPFDNSQVPFYYNYPVTIQATNGAPLIGTPVLDSMGKLNSFSYGAVSYLLANGSTGCTGSSAIVPVNADGTDPFGSQCFGIDTSNTQIPNILTTYTVTPVYNDPNYASVTGTPVTFIALRSPMVTITSNPGALTIPSGSTATTTLTLSSLLGYGITGINGNLNNYSLPVELSCDALPAHATCSFTYPNPDPSSPTAVAVTPTVPGTVMMTVNTNVSVGTTKASLDTKSEVLAALLGFGMMGLAFVRKKTYKASLLTVLTLLFFSAAMVSLSACSSANISTPPVLTTPKGTFMITVTAKQSGSKTIPSSTPGGAPIPVYGSGNQVSLPFQMAVTIQ